MTCLKITPNLKGVKCSLPYAHMWKILKEKIFGQKKCLLGQEEFHYFEHPMFYFSGFFIIHFFLLTHLH